MKIIIFKECKLNLKNYLNDKGHGGISELARKINAHINDVGCWARNKRSVPVKRCVQIEKLTDGVVTRRELRPDDYWEIWPDLAKDETPEKAA